MIRAILLDIDGTLTNDQKIITPKTKEILLRAQDHGIRLALASGRTDHGLMKWAHELEMDTHDGILICYNGAKSVSCQSGEVYYSRNMTMDESRAVLEHMKNFDVTPIVAKDEYMHTTDVFGCSIFYKGRTLNIVEYEARGNNYILCEHRDMARWVQFPIEKILTAAEPAYLQAHYEEMRKPFRDTLSCMFTSDFYYEFTARDVNKASAIEATYAKLGIAREELIAFGDAENDLPMLKYAGIGVAMGNAFASVKAAADEITADNNHDGIAVSLLRHLPELA